MSTYFDDYLPFSLSPLQNHIINAAEEDFHGGIFKLRWFRAWWIKPARLARTPFEISFVVGITVAVLESSESIGYNYIITWWGVLF